MKLWELYEKSDLSSFDSLNEKLFLIVFDSTFMYEEFSLKTVGLVSGDAIKNT